MNPWTSTEQTPHDIGGIRNFLNFKQIEPKPYTSLASANIRGVLSLLDAVEKV